MDSGGRRSSLATSGSPKSSSQSGNLTGSARVLSDSVVSFYNAIQKWNVAYLNGVRLIQNIQQKNEINDELQTSCEKLGELVDVLRNQSAQLASISEKLNNGSALLQMSSSSGIVQHKQQFGISWSYANFVDSTSALSKAYLKETERKEKVAKLLKEYSPSSKEFETLVLAWIQLSTLGKEEEMMLKAVQYEANLGSPSWGD